jgi:hypothetical protein
VAGREPDRAGVLRSPRAISRGDALPDPVIRDGDAARVSARGEGRAGGSCRGAVGRSGGADADPETETETEAGEEEEEGGQRHEAMMGSAMKTVV